MSAPRGGQYCRNDRKTSSAKVVNIAGMAVMTETMGWSTSPEQVVSIVGMGGQHGSESPLKKLETLLTNKLPN